MSGTWPDSDMSDKSGKGVCINCGHKYEHRNWEGICHDCVDRNSIQHDPLALLVYDRISKGGNLAVMSAYVANIAREHLADNNIEERLVALATKIEEALQEYNTQHLKMGE